MTMAPPTTTSPDTNAPMKPRATRVKANAGVTPNPRPSPAWAAWYPGLELPEARVVGGQLRELAVRDDTHQRLLGREQRVARVASIRLEEQHLLGEVAGRLAGQTRDQPGDVAATILAVADHALRGHRPAPRDRVRLGPDRRGLSLLRGEECRDLIEPQELDLLGVGLHLGRGTLARGVVLDLLLEVGGIETGDARLKVGPAIAVLAVAGRARDDLREGRIVERPSRLGCPEPGQERERHSREDVRDASRRHGRRPPSMTACRPRCSGASLLRAGRR